MLVVVLCLGGLLLTTRVGCFVIALFVGVLLLRFVLVAIGFVVWVIVGLS